MDRNTITTALDFVGATFVGIDTMTSPKLRGGRKNPHQSRITKLTYDSQVMAFTSGAGYENMVNRRLAEEGKPSFEVGPRAWGERIPNTPFVEHGEKMYLEVIFLKAGKSTFFLDGAVIAREDIEGLEEAQEGRQGDLEEKVIIRTFALDSIVALRANGQTWR